MTLRNQGCLWLIALVLGACSAAKANGVPPGAAEAGYAARAAALCLAAEAQYYRGHPEAGLRLLDEAKAQFRGEAVPIAVVAALELERAKLLHYRASLSSGDYREALRVSLEAVRTSEELRVLRLLADALDLSGLTLYRQAFENGQFAAAEPYFVRALELRRKLGGSARHSREPFSHGPVL